MKNKFVLAAVWAAGLLSFSACDGLVDDGDNGRGTPSGDLVLNVSKTIIQADGNDAATFEVLYNGESVTEGVTIYDDDNNVVDLPSLTFTTTQTGTYSFWAAYGTSFTETVTVTAIGFAVPELPEDPQPESTSFARKVLLTQFTGTGCGYCPGTISAIRTVSEDEAYSSKFLVASCHSFNSNDPAYSDETSRLAVAMGFSGSAPVVNMDLSSLSYTSAISAQNLRTMVDQAYGRTSAKAGIAASAQFDGGTLVVTASVKAAETADFRIGAWLLEDGIYGRQSNYNQAAWPGDYNTHDNCIRIADSRVSNYNYTGYSLGTVEAGDTAEYAFVMDLDDSWVTENLHLVIFVTTPEDNAWVVNNAVSCDADGSVAFDYE